MSFLKKHKKQLIAGAAGSLVGMPFITHLFGRKKKKRHHAQAMAQYHQTIAATQTLNTVLPPVNSVPNSAMIPHVLPGAKPTSVQIKSGYMDGNYVYHPPVK
jgi:hypothetical protein